MRGSAETICVPVALQRCFSFCSRVVECSSCNKVNTHSVSVLCCSFHHVVARNVLVLCILWHAGICGPLLCHEIGKPSTEQCTSVLWSSHHSRSCTIIRLSKRGLQNTPPSNCPCKSCLVGLSSLLLGLDLYPLSSSSFFAIEGFLMIWNPIRN